jgi:DNA primase
VVVEGYLDVISLSPYVHAFAPLGTSASAETLAKLFRQSAEIYVCFDGDQAGRKASLQLALKMLPLLSPKDRLFFVFLPPQEDPHSLIVQKGYAAFESYLQSALSLSEFLWEMLRQNYTESAGAEQKARAQQQWNEWMDQVHHPILRQSYQRFFKERTYQARFTQKQAAVRSAPEKEDILSLHEKILLGVCVHFPYILLQVQEFLAELNLSHPYFSELQHALLMWCDEQFQDSAEDFDSFLERKTGTRWREKMQSTLVHIPKNLHDDPEALVSYWKNLFDDVRQHLYQKETLKDLQKNAFSPESWESLCQLYRLKYPEDL